MDIMEEKQVEPCWKVYWKMEYKLEECKCYPGHMFSSTNMEIIYPYS